MTSCSAIAREAGEPLAGTAPEARLWLAVEQPGPWGTKALLDSHLPAGLGKELTARTADRPVRAQLIRRLGAHPDRGASGPRVVILARTSGMPRLWRAVVDDPHDVLDLDLEAVLAGAEPGLGSPDPGSVLLVCTNGRRDLCCARHGRAAAAALAAAGHTVWETTHLGGHRFSPTFVRLPDGWVFGGAAAESMTTAAARGRSALPPGAQVAELAVLGDRGVAEPTGLPVVESGPGSYLVDGQRVSVAWEPLPAPRPESCGKPAVDRAAPVAVLLG